MGKMMKALEIAAVPHGFRSSAGKTGGSGGESHSSPRTFPLAVPLVAYRLPYRYAAVYLPANFTFDRPMLDGLLPQAA